MKTAQDIPTRSLSIVMMGATGAVGQEVVKSLVNSTDIEKITLLGRKIIPSLPSSLVAQHIIDVSIPTTYQEYVANHRVAICTLGVGEPSKTGKENFIKIDKVAVIDFAKACKQAGIEHFELLASVGISATSASFYLRTKGELVNELKTLNFERLSIFKPSMILTPSNRYGLSQAITLRVWPWLKPILLGSFRKYRGIKVADLGSAIALNISEDNRGYEELVWDDFERLSS